jgi:Fe2+ or Zn2+ uptake regulation protein
MKQQKTDDIPYYYLFVYSKLKDKCWHNSYLSIGIIKESIKHECRQIPNELIYPMLSQMEKYGLIKRINQIKYKILDESSLSKFNKCGKYWKSSIKPDGFQESIKDINEDGKMKCEDASVYKLLPNKAVNKLSCLNCWFIKS